MSSKGYVLAVLVVSILVVSFSTSFAAEKEQEQLIKIDEHDVSFFPLTATTICYVDKKPKATVNFFGDMRFVEEGYMLVEIRNIKVAIFPKRPEKEGDRLETEVFFKIGDSDWISEESEEDERYEKLIGGEPGDFVEECLSKMEIP